MKIRKTYPIHILVNIYTQDKEWSSVGRKKCWISDHKVLNVIPKHQSPKMCNENHIVVCILRKESITMLTDFPLFQPGNWTKTIFQSFFVTVHFPGWLENKFHSNLQYPSVTTNHSSNNGLVCELFVLMYRCSILDRKTEAQYMDNANLRNLPFLRSNWIKMAGVCELH